MLKHPILLPIALMLFLALLTFWINQTVQEQGLNISRLNRHDPDYMLYNFVSTRTNAAGKTKYVLAATEMRHFPDNDYPALPSLVWISLTRKCMASAEKSLPMVNWWSLTSRSKSFAKARLKKVKCN